MAYVKRKYLMGENVKAPLVNPVKGIVQIISNFGVGKTTFMLGCGYQPEDIVFINDDVKEPPDFKWKKYVNLVNETSGMKPLELHDYCLELIKKLPKSKVLIWDTWQRFEKTMFPFVNNDPKMFREKHSPMGAIKGAEIWNDSFDYESSILAELGAKFDLIMLSTHLKPANINGVRVPDVFVPDQKKPMSKNADLRIWLTPNTDSQVPVGLVLKNISKSTVGRNGIETEQVLPQRISKCDWVAIGKYWDKPIADRKPEVHERPSEFELSLIQGHLTIEQRRMFEAAIGLVERQNKEQDELDEVLLNGALSKLKARVKELNGSPVSILNIIKAEIESGELEYNEEIGVSDIVKWRFV